VGLPADVDKVGPSARTRPQRDSSVPICRVRRGEEALRCKAASLLRTWGAVYGVCLEAEPRAADLATPTAAAAAAATAPSAAADPNSAILLGELHEHGRQLLVRHRQQVHQIRCAHQHPVGL